MLTRRKSLQIAASALAIPFVSRASWAQAYPNQPVRIVVGFPAGGPQDFHGRLFAQWLFERLGQSFVVENRTGASGVIGTEAVVRARPDGYTLLVLGTANTLGALAADKLSFSIATDLTPVAGIMSNMYVMAVNPSVPVRSVPEFIAYTKANPSRVNMGSAGIGTAQHVSGELFKILAGVNFTHVPYRGDAPAIADLIAGTTQMAFVSITSALEYIRAGTLRPLAVTGSTRSQSLPEVPTVASFLPGFESTSFIGISAPKGTSSEIIALLNRELNAGLADPGIQARYADLGANLIPGTPADFGNLVNRETEKWGRVFRAAGIKN